MFGEFTCQKQSGCLDDTISGELVDDPKIINLISERFMETHSGPNLCSKKTYFGRSVVTGLIYRRKPFKRKKTSLFSKLAPLGVGQNELFSQQSGQIGRSVLRNCRSADQANNKCFGHNKQKRYAIFSRKSWHGRKWTRWDWALFIFR